MNIEQIFRMILRRVVGRAVNAGVDAGLDAVSKRARGKGRGKSQPMTEEERAAIEERERIRAIRQARRAKRDHGSD
ncbi:hypothetical protein [Phaeobacter italicus]|uniref:hypothetical protein n=1 Tax=Phaeobacter italicus TaxID=481446 RepID=UPI00242D4273|nr:hypothetical protein [Phaeobacter italicus]MCI5101966.1 hypothetical protein [Phaeobacter italicus]